MFWAQRQENQLTLEVAFAGFFRTGKRNLRNFGSEKVPDSLVCNVTDLVVLLDDLAAGIADATIPGFGKGVADIIVRADIAIDACPPIVTFTRFALAGQSVGASSK